MYKKITHNIVEEHFDHPIASQIKKTVERRMGSKARLVDLSTMTKEDWNKALSAWRMKFQECVDKLIHSVNGTEEDLKFAEELAFGEVSKLGELLRPIYGIDVAERMNQGFRSYIIGLVQVVHLMKAGLDIRDWTNNRFNNLIAGDIFSTLNPINNTWSFQNIRNGLVSMSDAWVAAMKARLAKNSAEEMKQTDTATNALKNFITEIYNGTIGMYPEKFLTPVPMGIL